VNTPAVVGAFALCAFWLEAVLVAAAAWQGVRELWRLRARAADLWVGEVAEVEGPAGELACHEVSQLGRGLESGAVAFRDVSYTSAVSGGALRAATGELFRVPAGARYAVWVAGHTTERLDAREAAWAAACSPAGLSRTLSGTVRIGERVFLGGDSSSGEGILASFNPRPWLRARLGVSMTFICGELTACAAATALTLWPPAWGPVCTAGGVLCLVLFLAITPLGVALRDWCRTPDRAFHHRAESL
jgi:hypothetical protein